MPTNGMIICSLGDDGVEDTCNFTCNTGYELIGSETRTCLSNGSWSGDDVMCRRGRQLLHVHIMQYCYVLLTSFFSVLFCAY